MRSYCKWKKKGDFNIREAYPFGKYLLLMFVALFLPIFKPIDYANKPSLIVFRDLTAKGTDRRDGTKSLASYEFQALNAP